MPRLVVLAAVLWLTLVGSHIPGSAQVASPFASAATRLPLDLATMALVAEDLPDGFFRGVGDIMTPGNLYGIAFAPHVSHERLAEAGFLRDYEAYYAADEGSDSITVSVDEYATPEGAKAGFAAFAEETRPAPNFTVLSVVDLLGPEVGTEPKAFTATTYQYRDGSTSRFVDTTFRIENLIARVAYERFPKRAERPEKVAAATAAVLDGEYLEQVAEVEAMAATLAARIEAVLAGETPLGTDPDLAAQVLPLAELPDVWNGQSWEGYRDAEVVLGREGQLLDRFDAAFQQGYARTVSLGTGSSPRPPFLSVAVVRLSSPEMAQALLGAIGAAPGDLPATGPFGRGAQIAQMEGNTMTGVDESAAFAYALGEAEEDTPADSAMVVTAKGSKVVVVEAQGAGSSEAAVAIAQDLAAQQAACLRTEQACTEISLPSRS